MRCRPAANAEVSPNTTPTRSAGFISAGTVLNHICMVVSELCGDYLDLMDLAGKQPDNSVVSQQDVLDIIGTQQHLNFNPGSAFRYENSRVAS
jgi:hypothetical protein